jgi:hypothetical protein
MDDVLTSEEIAALFGSNVASKVEEVEKESDTQEETKDKTTDDNGKSQSQESGGGEKGEENTPEHNAEVSPNVFSSIAKALKDEGVFPDLNLDEITDASSFRKMFETQVDSRLNAQQKRVIEALDYGLEPTAIQTYESACNYLFSLKDQDITAENTQGEKIRRDLIEKSYLVRGFTQERAKAEVEKSFKVGSEIDDAKTALEDLKKHFVTLYESEKKRAKEETESYRKKYIEDEDNFKKSVNSKEHAFGSVALDNAMKNKIVENVLKPKYKTEDGRYLTEMEKYQKEHYWDFVRYMGAFFTLTDGFKDFGKLFKPVAQKAVKDGFAQLEDVLTGAVNKDSSLKLMGDNSKGEFGSGKWKIDLDID